MQVFEGDVEMHVRAERFPLAALSPLLDPRSVGPLDGTLVVDAHLTGSTRALQGTDVRVASVIGFPFGADTPEIKALEEFLPDGLACPSCGGSSFERERDILDVWFDSGSTHRAIRETHPELAERWDRALERRRPGEGVAYLEGPDQHRGWFNSSLMVGIGLSDRAPYTEVYTHGWVLDAQGRAMHKSLGNVISPMDVVGKSGAEIVRWWALATDWRSDVRVGDEILVRVSEAYRKVRNTCRYLISNLYDFEPARHTVAEDRLDAIRDALAGAVGTRPAFSVEVGGLGVFRLLRDGAGCRGRQGDRGGGLGEELTTVYGHEVYLPFGYAG